MRVGLVLHDSVVAVEFGSGYNLLLDPAFPSVQAVLSANAHLSRPNSNWKCQS